MPRRKIGTILQARVGSTRLPGKVLKLLAGKPMIQWVIERLQVCQRPDILILATSGESQDDPLVKLAQKLNVYVFRGSEHDVLDRYYQCACIYELSDIVRATGDNPFVDPEECDRLIDFYQNKHLDYATVVTGNEYGYPLGVGVEIFSFSSLEKSWQGGKKPHHREHVNEYILENPGVFRQAKMTAPPEKCAPELSLTVDLQKQFIEAEKLYVSCLKHKPSQLVSVEWVIKNLKKQNERL